MKSEKARNWNKEIGIKYDKAIEGHRFKGIAFERGYLNKDKPILIKPYSGRKGKGITVEYQTDISNQYHRKEYWIK